MTHGVDTRYDSTLLSSGVDPLDRYDVVGEGAGPFVLIVASPSRLAWTAVRTDTISRTSRCGDDDGKDALANRRGDSTRRMSRYSSVGRGVRWVRDEEKLQVAHHARHGSDVGVRAISREGEIGSDFLMTCIFCIGTDELTTLDLESLDWLTEETCRIDAKLDHICQSRDSHRATSSTCNFTSPAAVKSKMQLHDKRINILSSSWNTNYFIWHLSQVRIVSSRQSGTSLLRSRILGKDVLHEHTMEKSLISAISYILDQYRSAYTKHHHKYSKADFHERLLFVLTQRTSTTQRSCQRIDDDSENEFDTITVRLPTTSQKSINRRIRKKKSRINHYVEIKEAYRLRKPENRRSIVDMSTKL